MKQLNDAFRYRQPVPLPRSTRQLIGRFDHVPHNSVTALLRKAGPFKAERDGFIFTNTAWPITEEDAAVLRARYQELVDAMWTIGISMLRTALTGLSFPVVGGIPIATVDWIIAQLTNDLRRDLTDKIVGSWPHSYGRCGGMAFAGLDFFLVGRPVDKFGGGQPASGELRAYIWTRLLESLELNAATFFEWVMVLHILPVISTAASAALGAAAGSLGGLLGAAILGFIAGREDVLDLGGSDDVLGRTREHWGRLRWRLDHEAAWPIGFVYGSSALPIEQHQVLAIGYTDPGDGTATLTIWDNVDGTAAQVLFLDFRGDQLFVNSAKVTLNDIKGIICEEYAWRMPPAALHL